MITAIGPLSAPTLPREGVDWFEGQSFHTATLPHEPVNFAGKRVAVIGSGATGVQTIAEVAEWRQLVLEPLSRFDSESYSNGYSFSKEVLEEWIWSEHFAPQPEPLRYLNYVTAKRGRR